MTLKHWHCTVLQGRNEVYGIRDDRAGIWDLKPWDRDWISITVRGLGSSSFLGYNNQDHKILKCALIGRTCQRFKIQLYFCCNIWIRYQTVCNPI